MLKYMFLMQDMMPYVIFRLNQKKVAYSRYMMPVKRLNPILQHIKLQKHEETTFSLYKHVKNVKVYVPYARHDAVRNI